METKDILLHPEVLAACRNRVEREEKLDEAKKEEGRRIVHDLQVGFSRLQELCSLITGNQDYIRLAKVRLRKIQFSNNLALYLMPPQNIFIVSTRIHSLPTLQWEDVLKLYYRFPTFMHRDSDLGGICLMLREIHHYSNSKIWKKALCAFLKSNFDMLEHPFMEELEKAGD